MIDNAHQDSDEDFTTPHKITILDSNIQLRRDSALYAKLQPLAAMLPYLFKQSNSSVGPILLHSFPLDRLHSIPQVSSPFDFVFSLFSSYMLMLPVRLKNA
ncbi:putative Ulp1 protease family catalytic domain-containing protein [Arabidopsis thaliana]